MDEAERCHDLAILDRGRLIVADTPENLRRDIGVSVIEVETEDPRAARRCLQELPWVRSVAQLGTRLHALVDPQLADPADRPSRARSCGTWNAIASPAG